MFFSCLCLFSSRVHFLFLLFSVFLLLFSVYAVLHRIHLCTAELDTLRAQYEAATSAQQATTAEAEDLGGRLRQLGEEAGRAQQECEELTRMKEQREAEVCRQAPPLPRWLLVWGEQLRICLFVKSGALTMLLFAVVFFAFSAFFGFIFHYIFEFFNKYCAFPKAQTIRGICDILVLDEAL